MALFGRDSLITSFQALPYLPGLAATTLRVLAARQAEVRDDFHEQEPGKILHELRFGELTALGERPHSPYFGTRRRDAAVPRPARRVPPLDRRRRARPGARAQRPCGAGLDRRQRRPRRRRLRRVRAPQPGHRPRQPVLEGQLELDPVRRRPARAAGRSRPARSRATSTTRNGARARLAREVWGDEALAAHLEQRADDLRDALPPRLLDARARLPRARARRRQTPGRQPDLQHRPPAVVGPARRRRGGRHRRAAARRAALLRLGRPHPRHATRPATTRSATTPARSGRTTTR